MSLILRSEILDFLPKFPKEQTLAVTLTMKQQSRGLRLDEIKASQNMRHFLNLMNAKYFGTNFKRHNKRLSVIASLGGLKDGRLHYHLAIKMPDPKLSEEFKKTIEFFWGDTDFCDKEIKIKDAYDTSGWNYYLTKSDAEIDWENTHIA